MKLVSPLESDEQKALVEWLSYHPLLKDYFCKIDNEGKRTTFVKNGKTIQVGLFNSIKKGLRPGAYDLFIYFPTPTYHGLWLEVKRRKIYTASEQGTPSWKSQERFGKLVQSVGFAAEVCYGWEDGVRIIESYLLS